MNNLLMPEAPQADASQQPTRSFSDQDAAGAHSTLKAVMDGLMSVATKPKGALSKQDVFNAVAEMIANGAFSTPQEKQAIVAQLAQMPDEEGAIRQMVGQKLLRVANLRDLMHQHYPPGAPNA